ncbi:unnamed protein product [Rhizophagus irregularis]|nr:unnamed protein product [Rhizophagus irregularis]
MQYTGRFEISYKVQSRLLRKSHPDSHYCAALFRYTRLFAIKFCKFACFISADDKHKVPVGETVETLIGVHNKATLASLGTELTSCDHDFTKLSVTPSISLFCEIPKDITAVQTAPYHSWTNPAERVMSIINLGLQNVVLKRSDMILDSEIIFKSLRTIEDIRNASSFNQTLSEELKMAIKNTQKTLETRTERLKLKNQKFKCIEPAALEEINGLFEILGEKIDNTVTQNGTSQNKLRTCVDLQKFIKSHCLIREYSFQIKKCGESDCLICDPVRLPHEIFNQLHYIPDPQISSNPDHYQDFDSLYGQNTTEKDIPSKKNHHECKELAPSGILVAARVCDFVFCISCSKLRCLFSQYVLDDSDYEALQTAMETFAYTCGSPIVPENHFLYDKVFVRMNLTCNLPIEQVYYSCKIEHSQICYYCGEEDNLVEPSQEILSQFKQYILYAKFVKKEEKIFLQKAKYKCEKRDVYNFK